MSDEQVVDQTTKSEVTSTAPPETPPPATTERAGRAMNRLLRGVASASPATSEQPAPSSESTSADEFSTSIAPDEVLTFKTKEERDRYIQSEVDRRESVRAQRAAEQAKRDERRRKLQDDPYTAAAEILNEMDQGEESTKQVQERATIAQQVLTSLDQKVLDKFFLKLPAADQKAVLSETSHMAGIDARGEVADRILDRLTKHLESEALKKAEARLRGNPSFIKQMMTEVRGDRDEPEVVSGAPNGAKAFDMNSFLRGHR